MSVILGKGSVRRPGRLRIQPPERARASSLRTALQPPPPPPAEATLPGLWRDGTAELGLLQLGGGKDSTFGTVLSPVPSPGRGGSWKRLFVP